MLQHLRRRWVCSSAVFSAHGVSSLPASWGEGRGGPTALGLLILGMASAPRGELSGKDAPGLLALLSWDPASASQS